MKGRFILVVGPSGSGKSALLSYLHEVRPDIVFPISCTTREPRPGEVPGEKYYFITREEFYKREQAGEFLEWAEYSHNYYGVIKMPVLKALEEGKLVVREVEVQGAQQIVKNIPSGVLRIIFIDAGGWESLEKRILSRASIDPSHLLARRKRYEEEVLFKDRANIVVRNFDGQLEQAKKDFVNAIEELAK